MHDYIHVMNEAIKMLENLPFSARLVKSVDKVLLQGARGKRKQPRELEWRSGIMNFSFIK